MAFTNYPNGITSFGVPVVGSNVLTAGKVLWVNYTTGIDGSDRGTSPSYPIKTLDYAIGLCNAGKGDVIFLMPGHAESVIVASGIRLDVDTVQIIGLGTGSARPTFNFGTATTATINMSADNVTIENCIFDLTAGALDAVATAINWGGANCRISKCKFMMATSSYQATSAITLTSGASEAVIEDCRFYAPNAGAVAAIYGAAATDQVRIRRNWFYGAFSTAAITNATTAWTNTLIEWNTYFGTTASKPHVSLVSTATGVVQFNTTGVATLSANGSISCDACFKFENYATDTLTAGTSSGILDPVGVTL